MNDSRLTLDRVTLVAIDTFNPNRTMNAIRFCLRQVTFQDVVLVCLPGFTPKGGWGSVRPHYAAITAKRLKRELFMLTRLHEVFTTSHCINMEWDSSVANPQAWEDSWLELDYIGAPWPWPYKELVDCRADNCVGNSGFALMSKRFLQTVSMLSRPTEEQLRLSDVYMCRVLRPELERRGIKFATEKVAERFSCENRIYSGQFGWHGKSTAARNGWNIDVLCG